MSTAKATFFETVATSQLRGLPSRKAGAAERLGKIRDLASSLLDEAESLDHENSLAEMSSAVENLNLKSGVDFFDEVRRFEIRLISRALELPAAIRREPRDFGPGNYHSQLQNQILRNSLGAKLAVCLVNRLGFLPARSTADQKH